ncbi:SAM-dependent methyltransferase [Methylobacterium tarhaniae]|uniref:SAM-dependent methyltransferase n=1 Tax=Methylobacterium tarhaniae TaxID=1187852 RepID=UPI00069F1734|nr:SAM-dependent methyltransferase [Methylobacterium tarhaniae]
MPDRDPAGAGPSEDLHFTHAIDIPGHGTVRGEIDLRGAFASCLAGVPLHGKRVLDVGALSGFTSFALEALGAEVVSYDRAGGRHWDLVPFCTGAPAPQLVSLLDAHQARISRAYRFSHAAFGSRAERIEGDLYSIPAAIGPVDAALIGSLPHLRDPLRALHGALRLVQETAVIVGLLPRPSWLARLDDLRGDAPLAFLPRTSRTHPSGPLWRIPPRTVVRWLRILGFGETRIAYRRCPSGDRTGTLYAVVGRRTQANRSEV